MRPSKSHIHAGAMRSALCALAAVVAAGAISPSPAAGQPVDGKFDVGGRAIRLACFGEGTPTVVIDAGMGASAVGDEAWRRIAQRVAQTTRVCLSDRAGLGQSDPAPMGAVRTSADAAVDLERALKAAGIAPPFLLAGHSIGGLNAQVFASRFNQEVAGLVLISSTHPDQAQMWLAELPAPSDQEPQALTRSRTYLTKIQSDPSLNPERLDVAASNLQARALRSLGDRPVIVVTHSPRWRMEPELPEPLAERLEAVTQDLQKRFLSLSSASSQTIAPSAGHGLPHEDPAFVAKHILQGVEAVRAKRQ
ncbi:alpha/beta fold hydrolase [Caulobacter segnis]